ncbi:phosphoglucosamine mutase [Sediminivirga luteola]|uniref:Phosphoglucosamine mutase n=1 Tax=Sediminivirga luteola TaxID=1774748 RepID=A0A8J2TWZ0_9MICO|nr:phosphoglucosamine mutase [Sediminivirga luteola]MCI2265476.1 phosphoglucosamine mutase [Sediminivirga luteola]GGA10344.1 phosphoglucosamine mutase [Sediminivirga luteola]
MARLFGTDGVRGLANKDVTVELALDVSVAAARVLGASGRSSGRRPVAVVGRDTRISGDFLAAAVCAGLASAGVEVHDAGVLPTPGLAYAVQRSDADLGVMLSASHNPMPDNGIKFFARGGTKLPDHVEDEIEALIGTDWERPTGADVGRVVRYPAATDQYTEHLVAQLGGDRPLAGLRVVVDCAHGAASIVGPAALRQAGAEVIVMGAEPNGHNINDGIGSTHTQPLQAAVLEHAADAGVAFDGDADRCLAVDSQGRLVDGDQIMGILAIGLKESGKLAKNTLVTTVMSNLGLRLAMQRYGIDVVQTAVGDRYVLEEMLEHGYVLGGEQSGHLLMLDHGTTGDGVQTALHLLGRMVDSRRTLADLAAEIAKLPQVLINVPDVDKNRVSEAVIVGAVAEVETELGETGRVLLRASGTEPLIRVMVEAETEEIARDKAQYLADVVGRELGFSRV